MVVLSWGGALWCVTVPDDSPPPRREETPNDTTNLPETINIEKPADGSLTWKPASMTTAPSFTHSPLTISGFPAPTTKMSARPTCTPPGNQEQQVMHGRADDLTAADDHRVLACHGHACGRQEVTADVSGVDADLKIKTTERREETASFIPRDLSLSSRRRSHLQDHQAWPEAGLQRSAISGDLSSAECHVTRPLGDHLTIEQEISAKLFRPGLGILVDSGGPGLVWRWRNSERCLSGED
ncbi:hypothetical protein CRUP_033143 [Coryphaenoides rupestris]|nr:hypothetical protein CRUP_033143 [Coryphaenoides rupestris]